MTKIQKTSSYLLVIFNCLLVYLPLNIILFWTFIDADSMKNLFNGDWGHGFGWESTSLLANTPDGPINMISVKWTVISKAIGFGSAALGTLPTFLGVLALRSVFKNYKKGDVFNVVNAIRYRYIGWLFVLSSLITKPISDGLLTFATTHSNAPGHRYLTLSFGTTDLGTVFYGVMIIIISWVMLEASKLQEEQKFTI